MFGGKQIEVDRTLSYYGIKNENTVYLVFRLLEDDHSKSNSRIKTNDPESTSNIKNENNDLGKMAEVKNEDNTSTNASEINLLITNKDIGNFSLQVNLNDTIGAVKKQIQEKQGISPDSYRFGFGANKYENDAKKLSDCGVSKTFSVLNLVYLTKEEKNQLKVKTEKAQLKPTNKVNPVNTKDKNTKKDNGSGKKMRNIFAIALLVGVSAVLIWYFVTKNVKDDEDDNDEED
jgi:hypothetical protein